MTPNEVERAALIAKQAADLARATGYHPDDCRRTIQNALDREHAANRWAAFTNDELRAIMALCHAATGERLSAFEHWRIADEIDAELARRKDTP